MLLPYGIDFEMTAKCLEFNDLGEQCADIRFIIQAIEQKKPLSRFPFIQIWENDINILKYFYAIMRKEWIVRRYNNSMQFLKLKTPSEFPSWLLSPQIIYSHRCQLLKKNPDYYSNLWDIKTEDYLKCPSYWPVPALTWTQSWDDKANDYFATLL